MGCMPSKPSVPTKTNTTAARRSPDPQRRPAPPPPPPPSPPPKPEQQWAYPIEDQMTPEESIAYERLAKNSSKASKASRASRVSSQKASNRAIRTRTTSAASGIGFSPINTSSTASGTSSTRSRKSSGGMGSYMKMRPLNKHHKAVEEMGDSIPPMPPLPPLAERLANRVPRSNHPTRSVAEGSSTAPAAAAAATRRGYEHDGFVTILGEQEGEPTNDGYTKARTFASAAAIKGGEHGDRDGKDIAMTSDIPRDPFRLSTESSNSDSENPFKDENILEDSERGSVIGGSSSKRKKD